MNTFGKPPCPECKCLIGLGSRHERREACPWRSRTRQGFFCEQTLPLLALDPSAFLKYTHYGGVRPVHRLRKRAEISSPSLTPCSSLKHHVRFGSPWASTSFGCARGGFHGRRWRRGVLRVGSDVGVDLFPRIVLAQPICSFRRVHGRKQKVG